MSTIPGPVLTDEFIHKWFQSCLNFLGIRCCHYIEVQVAFARIQSMKA